MTPSTTPPRNGRGVTGRRRARRHVPARNQDRARPRARGRIRGRGSRWGRRCTTTRGPAACRPPSGRCRRSLRRDQVKKRQLWVAFGRARREFPGRRAPTSDPDWLTLGQAAKYLGRRPEHDSEVVGSAAECPRFTRRAGTGAIGGRTSTTSSTARARAARRSRGPLVLIVDDDERVREYVRVNLEMEGYAVREAGNAEEGLGVLEEVSPDLILPRT